MKNTWIVLVLALTAVGAQADPDCKLEQCAPEGEAKFDNFSLENVCGFPVKITGLNVKYNGGEKKVYDETSPEIGTGYVVGAGEMLRFFLEHDSMQSIDVTSSAKNKICFHRRSYNMMTGAVHPVVAYRFHCRQRGAKYAVYLSASRRNAEVWENGKPAPFGQLDCLPPMMEGVKPGVGAPILQCSNRQVADAGVIVTFTKGWIRPIATISELNMIGEGLTETVACRRF